jgi:hypothetical protein
MVYEEGPSYPSMPFLYKNQFHNTDSRHINITY